MTESTSSLPLLVRILLDRISELEAKLETATKTAANPPPDVAAARVRARVELAHQENLEWLRERPDLLAEVRARHARVNEFYASRGIPPAPEPYPELP